MSDPIRARLDEGTWSYPEDGMTVGQLKSALRAVLDLVDGAENYGLAYLGIVIVRRVIAEHLGVTDE